MPFGSVWFSVALRPQRRVGLLGTGTEWDWGERVKGSTAETDRKRLERPWTAARTMEVLRRCPLAIAQRLVHSAIALSTAVLDRITKTMSVALLLTNSLDNSKQKRPTCSAQLHLPTHDLFWAKLRVQLHLPPLRSLDLLISPGTLTRADDDDDELMLNVLRCQLTYQGQVVTNAEARFNKSLRPRKPEGSLGRTAQDVHLDSHTAPELCNTSFRWFGLVLLYVHRGELAY